MSAPFDSFSEQGFLFPLEGLSAPEADDLMRHVADLEEAGPGWLFARTTKKRHLLLTWLNQLIRDPRILDSTYWGLSKPDVVTPWVAFTPSNVENGCMRVIPGSQTVDQLPHRDTFGANSLLTRGQEVAVAVNAARAVDVVLAPGQFSLHHVRLVHGSEPNTSDGPRIGFAIRYLPTYVKQVSGNPDSATLVRGVDEFGHFQSEPAPLSDFHADAVAFHARSVESHRRILHG